MTKSTTNIPTFDVAVIGGGPAGTSTALYAARSGLKTILFEKQAYPRDKPCGGALGARCLPLLGPQARAEVLCFTDELRLYAPSFKHFSQSGIAGYFIRRQSFDAAMARDAQDAGAVIRDNCRVKAVLPQTDGSYRIESSEDCYIVRYVVVAWGFAKNALNRPLLPLRKIPDRYMAMTVCSETPVDNDIMTTFPGNVLGIFFGAVPNGYGWCFVKEGYVNIGVGATAALLKKQGAMDVYLNFVADLRTRKLLPPGLKLQKARQFPLPFKRALPQTVFGNVLLVGDAAGFVSPLTGEGLYYSIKGGQIAAQSILDSLKNNAPLTAYQDNWRKSFGSNLDKYGPLLQTILYKNRAGMELAVTLGRVDKPMAVLLNKLIYGTISYRSGLVRVLLRLPITLLKALFHR